MTPSNIPPLNPALGLGAVQFRPARGGGCDAPGGGRGKGSWEQASHSPACVLFLQGNVDANVQGVVEQVLTGDAGSSQKAVPPKALLDNCVKVMWLLYSESCE